LATGNAVVNHGAAGQLTAADQGFDEAADLDLVADTEAGADLGEARHGVVMGGLEGLHKAQEAPLPGFHGARPALCTKPQGPALAGKTVCVIMGKT
jgi:hypothetical protein